MPVPEKKISKPQDYKKMVLNLDIDNFELKTSSILEARMTLVGIERLEENLLEIRRDISRDMRSIKLKYLGHDHNKSSLLGSLKKTKASSRRKSLDNKCNRELEPYNKVLYIVDHYLKEIENVKDYINNLKT